MDVERGDEGDLPVLPYIHRKIVDAALAHRILERGLQPPLDGGIVTPHLGDLDLGRFHGSSPECAPACLWISVHASSSTILETASPTPWAINRSSGSSSGFRAWYT